MRRPPPVPPHPDLIRRPLGSFGWIEDRLLHEGWLGELGADAVAVLVLLALAADRQGASFYSRDRMASALGLCRAAVDEALQRLVDQRLVAVRPWRPGHRDGVWQLLPVPVRDQAVRQGKTMQASDLLRLLGFDGEPKTR